MATSSLQSSSNSSSIHHFKVFDTHLKLGQNEPTLLTLSPNNSKSNFSFRVKASSKITSELIMGTENSVVEQTKEEILLKSDHLFSGLKQNFLSFKRDKYLSNIEHFKNLADSQSPKFTVIACADSRVCPSTILGFQPGEAFIVRNVANLVPPFEDGPSETKAALEFSVNSLEVENILVVGHSRCGGIRALMSIPEDEEDDNSRSFIRSWVIVGKNARVNTKSMASSLSFDQQCHHCERESVNRSLINLLSYPWIKERVSNGKLSLHGGYYDFTNCSFEKWILDYQVTHENNTTQQPNFSIKHQEVWH